MRLSRSNIAQWIPKRNAHSHKGNFGHVLIIAGSRGMAGAGILCSFGALRGGSGLVTLAVPESQQPAVSEKGRPEAMTLALPETYEGTISVRALNKVINFIKLRKITSLAIGPGLSRNSQTKRFLKNLMEKLSKNPCSLTGIVLDADGFLGIKPKKKTSHPFKNLKLPIIVTPHPGELAKFTGTRTSAIQKNRMDFARKFAKLNHIITVLKGNKTVISDGRESYINPTGNPGMATGGSGDVLTGLIAALLGNLSYGPGESSFLLKAACAGVFIHGLAGDLAVKEKGAISMIAGDIAEKIPAAFQIVLSRRS